MRLISVISLIFFFYFQNPAFAQPQKIYSSSEILHALKKLNTVGSVLYIAAHPDDENTRLLTYFANEKLLRTGYLSITRGDGGQNLIGKEQGELLGLIRSHELLAARNIDGAEQFFTRANDFGYSKNPEETFRFWDHDKILSDVVWIIRTFKPDIIITRFPTTGEGGHGHHTASAILAGEAFKAAGNPKMFSEQLNYTETWQPQSIWWNTFNFGSNNMQRDDQFQIDVGLFNPLLGKWYGEIASESRSQHKSQGFGVARNRGKQVEFFKPLDGDTICGNIYCKLDFSWKRIKGGEIFQRLMDKTIQQFNPLSPFAVLPLLLNARTELMKISDDYWRSQKLLELDKIIISCTALWFEASASEYAVVPGDSVLIKFSIVKYSDIPLKLKSISVAGMDSSIQSICEKNVPVNIDMKIKTKPALDVSNPFWLNDKHETGIYNVSKQTWVSKPVNDASLTASFNVTLSNMDFNFNVPVVHKWTDPVKGELYRALEICPPAIISFPKSIYVFTGILPKKIYVNIKAQQDSVHGKIKIAGKLPFRIVPDQLPVTLFNKGDEQKFEFTAIPDSNISSGRYEIGAVLLSSSDKLISNSTIAQISYDHIPFQSLFPEAAAHFVYADIKTKGKFIGYIEGAGDDVSSALKQIGYEVVMLTDEMIESESLNQYDAVITGVRAFNTNKKLPGFRKKLLDYVNNGGNLIVQYNTNNFVGRFTSDIGPYPFKISRDRVTDEAAPVEFISPNHPLLNFPNKITSADFDGWIQERGLYFPAEIDSNYQTIIRCSDPGEKPLDNAIITCKFGKGNFVYSSLSFFRELPAGVPGAYRLFANMISLGRK